MNVTMENFITQVGAVQPGLPSAQFNLRDVRYKVVHVGWVPIVDTPALQRVLEDEMAAKKKVLLFVWPPQAAAAAPEPANTPKPGRRAAAPPKVAPLGATRGGGNGSSSEEKVDPAAGLQGLPEGIEEQVGGFESC
jgi:hypothetical protein